MKILRLVLSIAFVGFALSASAEKIYSVVSYNLGGPDYAPVTGDFDGDGKLDPAVYQETTGNWFTGLSSNGYAVASANLGGPGYAPVSGDFDGDGRADPAVYQEAGGNWYVRLSGSQYAVVWLPNFGEPGYLPVPGDYDGNGESELAVYQTASGNWYLLRGQDVEVTDINVLAVMYANAMVNASNVVASKIRRDLTAITENNNNLIWRTNPDTGVREVKVVSFMKEATAINYYHVGQYTPMRYVEAWVTLAPEAKNFSRNYTGTNLLLRLKQLLGLPANAANDTIVEYYVDPLYLLRPSRDPEITDQESEVAFRTNTPYLNMVSTNYVSWFQSTIESRNYGMTNGVWNAWPWTQLGYTYDWSKTGNNVMGLSEFVVPGPMLYNQYGVTSLNVYVVTVTNAMRYADAPAGQTVFSRGAVINKPAQPE